MRNLFLLFFPLIYCPWSCLCGSQAVAGSDMEGNHFEGDIAMRERIPLGSPGARFAALRDASKRWPGGKVPYRIDTNSIPNVEHHQIIRDAMDQISRKVTCVEFIENDKMAKPRRDFIRIAADGDENNSALGCWSYLGMIGGEQTLNLDGNCFRPDVITHELLHALSFIHEQNRSDRDDFVEIRKEHIKPGMEFQFIKRNESDVDDQNTPYDFRSRLHYPSNAFSKSDEDTIVAIYPGNDNFGPLDTGLSPIDVVEVSLLYDCEVRNKDIIEYIHQNRLANEMRIEILDGNNIEDIDDIKSQLNDTETELNSLRLEVEKYASNLIEKSELDDLKTQFNKLKLEHLKVTNKHLEDINSIRMKHSEDINDIKLQILSEIKLQHTEDINAIKLKTSQDMNAIKLKNVEDINAMEQKNTQLTNSLNQKHIDDINAINLKNMEAINAIEQKNMAAINAMKLKNVEDINAIEQENKQAIVAMEAKNTQAISAIEHKNVAATNALEHKYLEEISALKLQNTQDNNRLKTEILSEITSKETKPGPVGDHFGACVNNWCRQLGTFDQFLRCEEVRGDGLTCIHPSIKYGTTEGGVPSKHADNDYTEWCRQVLGFRGYSKVTYGIRDCAAPKGRIVWGTGGDEPGAKWKDHHDGIWRDTTLDGHDGCDTDGITSLTCSKVCPASDGWLEFGNNCYKLFTSKKNWSSARAHCQSEAAELASIHSLQEHNFVYNILQESSTWIGGNDKRVEGQWEWSDGSAWDYVNWYSDQPNAASDRVVSMYKNYNGQWFDSTESTAWMFVCKY